MRRRASNCGSVRPRSAASKVCSSTAPRSRGQARPARPTCCASRSDWNIRTISTTISTVRCAGRTARFAHGKPDRAATPNLNNSGGDMLNARRTAKTIWGPQAGAFRCSRLVALACAFLLPAQALAGAREKVAALAPSGVVFVVDEKGDELVAQNADKPFVPASVAKIVTAWLAMETLGADYRFETRFYLDSNRVLYIRGGGDPFLISEELAQLASALVAAIGKQPLSGIVLDASYYPSDIRIPGIEDTEARYDALNSALAVNFNTIHAVRKGKTVQSAEKQTPITP